MSFGRCPKCGGALYESRPEALCCSKCYHVFTTRVSHAIPYGMAVTDKVAALSQKLTEARTIESFTETLKGADFEITKSAALLFSVIAYTLGIRHGANLERTFPRTEGS